MQDGEAFKGDFERAGLKKDKELEFIQSFLAR